MGTIYSTTSAGVSPGSTITTPTLVDPQITSAGRTYRPGTYFQPEDHGLITCAFDPAMATAQVAVGTAGLTYVTRLLVPYATSVTNILGVVSVAGATLTANQCIAGLYQGGSLLGSTADQSGTWNSTGLKTMAISGGPVAVAAGAVYVAWYYNGTTSPRWWGIYSSAASSYPLNVGMAAGAARWGSADSGRTTSLPSSLGAISASILGTWFALS